MYARSQYTYTCTHAHKCVHVHTHALYTHLRMHVLAHIYIHTHMCTHPHVYTLHTRMYIHVFSLGPAPHTGTVSMAQGIGTEFL